MPTDATFESFREELNRLVESFGNRIAELQGPDYNEAKLRDDFLNPFFRALGWDLENRAGLIQKKREVEIESLTRIGGGHKRADYLFRVRDRDRLVCEAKKPGQQLHAKHAYQAKRYAWNKGVVVAILTDFEETKLYFVGGKPHIDEPDVGLWKTWRFSDYPTIARELWDLLARDQVAAGTIDRAIDELPKKAAGMGKARQQWLIKPDRVRALDNEFLEFLDATRRDLAADLYKNNDRGELMEGNRLNEAVQHIIDRILFLRICEDRDIDTGERLQSILEKWRKNTGNEDVGRRGYQQPMMLHEEPPSDFGTSGIRAPRDSLWRDVVRHFRALDRRPPTHVPFFNGNLFKTHFTENLVVSDEWLAGFISELSEDESPYLFDVIAVEILGSVYERFLGKVVRPQGRGITIEKKPEVRKAGGVYYTPRYIVDYIVEQTAGKLLDAIAKEASGLRDFAARTEKLRLLDPACGSGSFLIRAYERVCEHWESWLTSRLPAKADAAAPVDWERHVQKPVGARIKARRAKDPRAAWLLCHREFCWLNEATGDLHLTLHLKRQILTQNIYGVDLDAAAVEVTQLSLYLKMLEHENRATLERERELFSDVVALLPSLQDNIKCGNSLIAFNPSMLAEDLVRVQAFDWPVQFKPIMEGGGFDAVFGNPPYLNIDDTWGKGDVRLEALKIQYPHVYNDKTDLLFYFIARAYYLSKWRVSFIVSRAFLEAFKADKLRGFLADNKAVSKIVDFQNFLVFDEVGITTCIIQLEKCPSTDDLTIYKLLPDKLPSQALPELLSKNEIFEKHCVARASLTSAVWTFATPKLAALNAKLDSCGWPLGKILEIGQGMQTGCNEVFSGRTLAEMRAWKVPKGLYRFRVSNSDIQRYEVRNRREVLLWVEECSSFEQLPKGGTSSSGSLFRQTESAGGLQTWQLRLVEVHLASSSKVLLQAASHKSVSCIREQVCVG